MRRGGQGEVKVNEWIDLAFTLRIAPTETDGVFLYRSSPATLS